MAERCAAQGATLALVPPGHNRPHQTIVGRQLDLRQTSLATVAPLRPTRALFQPEPALTDRAAEGGMHRIDGHGSRPLRLGTGDQSLTAPHFVGPCRLY